MSDAMSTLIRKLAEHSRLSHDDRDAVASLSHTMRVLHPNEDLIRQGDDPGVSALVTSGILARYHLLASGRRQYLSYHLTGDMPDSQARTLDFRRGVLHIKTWERLAKTAQFNPSYLHLKKPPLL